MKLHFRNLYRIFEVKKNCLVTQYIEVVEITGPQSLSSET